jgi:hypothetical protein
VTGGFGLDELGVDGGFSVVNTGGDGDLILGIQGEPSSSPLYDNAGDPLPFVTSEGDGDCYLAAGGPCGAKG